MSGQLTKIDLIEALDEALNQRRNVNDELHLRHHEYIEMELKRREGREELWKRFRSSLVGGLAVTTIAGLGWVGTLIIESVRTGTHTG